MSAKSKNNSALSKATAVAKGKAGRLLHLSTHYSCHGASRAVHKPRVHATQLNVRYQYTCTQRLPACPSSPIRSSIQSQYIRSPAIHRRSRAHCRNRSHQVATYDRPSPSLSGGGAPLIKWISWHMLDSHNIGCSNATAHTCLPNAWEKSFLPFRHPIVHAHASASPRKHMMDP